MSATIVTHPPDPPMPDPILINGMQPMLVPVGSVGIPAERLAELERIERAWLPIYLTHQAIPTERLEALERLETLWKAWRLKRTPCGDGKTSGNWEEMQATTAALEAWKHD